MTTRPENSPPASPGNPSGIRDNYSRGNVAEFLISHIDENTELSIVSAYFTIYAFDALKDHLARIRSLRFLFGEPRFVQSVDPDRDQPMAFVIRDDAIALAQALEQKRVAAECAGWLRKKARIRSVVQSNFLHGKMYHVRNPHSAHAIVGSSNFTVRGLGLGDGGNNIELNVVLDRNADVADLDAWFDELWNDVELVRDVKDKVLAYLEQVYRDYSPEFVYFKTLFHLFRRFLDERGDTTRELEQTTLFDTQIWQALFDFQRDAVRGVINRILQYNGCILADSVGLGKTYEALAVIKYFELRNERVLVLCPKKLRDNWTVYTRNDRLNPFLGDRFRFDVLNHTDLSRDSGKSGDIDLETLNWGNYDLVVIDESHNFRNNSPGRKDENGNIVRRSRYQRLMEDIINAGVPTKVLLISATPVNTDLRDLRNQLYLITGGADDAFTRSLGIGSLREALRQAQARFQQWARLPEEKKTREELLLRLESDFFTLLDQLTIARSRKHILRYYSDTVQRIGGFPERARPLSVSPDIDTRGQFLSYDQVNVKIMGYRLSLFNPSRFVKPEYQAQYERRYGNFTQVQREDFLIEMMKVNFLKRLESSIHSFALTLERTIQKIDDLKERIARFRSLRETDAFLTMDLVDPGQMEDEELAAALEIGGKLKFRMAHLDIDQWEEELDHDRKQLAFLLSEARKVTPERDAKLAELKNLIAQKVRNPTRTHDGRQNRKVLVFTAFADTASYLYESLEEWARTELGIHIAVVTGTGNNRTTLGRSDFHHILTNFSPIAKNRARMEENMPRNEEIDLLIATDCISEGQNLQDCDYLINYDIHWNPVRIIQRFGRIDRIGSRNPRVQLVNFWPTPHLDKYIRLQNRVKTRMALVDMAATWEENILDEKSLEELVSTDLSYRDQQLLRLKDEVLDIEDLDESITLSDFTLDDFRIELLNYLEANRKALEQAPEGIFAVTPPHGDDPSAPKTASPGAIFCLRRRAEPTTPSPVNPLDPFYLIYVRADGEVRFTFVHPKQILALFRRLCLGKAEPLDELCRLFDQRTNQGQNVEHYSGLLERAVRSISGTFRRRALSGLQNRREFILPKRSEQPGKMSDYELVTWLVILGQETDPTGSDGK